MKIIVAPDSFKGSLSAVEVADSIEAGIKKANPRIEVTKIPLADGGEGTVEALVIATGGKILQVRATGPLGKRVDSFFGILGDGKTAVIEMAAASGLELVPPHLRNPLHTTTYGVGELMLAALENKCNKVIVGLGGSATNDGGMGMAKAMGVRFYDKNGQEVGVGGKHLGEVTTIKLDNIDSRLKEVEIIAASDVNNPLLGKHGASYIYAPQKGADEDTVLFLERGMENFAAIIKESLGIDISNLPGSGAAGGLGAGLMAFCSAKMKPGMEVVREICRLDEILKNADLLITGEGKTDEQTSFGKAPLGIAKVAKEKNVAVVCLSGGLESGFEIIYNHGIDAAFSSINMPMTLENAMAQSSKMLVQTAEAITRLAMKLSKSGNN